MINNSDDQLTDDGSFSDNFIEEPGTQEHINAAETEDKISEEKPEQESQKIPIDEAAESENDGMLISDDETETNAEYLTDEDNNLDEQSQSILNAEKNLKQNLTDQNKATFANRNRIIMIILFVFVLFILFFTFILPIFSNKTKKKEVKETDKAGKTYIPRDIISTSTPYNQNDRTMEDGNSAIASEKNEEDNNFDKKYPPPFAAQPEKEQESQSHVAPVSVTKNSSSSTVEVPLTNRNEQQKSMQRLSINNNSHSQVNKDNPQNQGVNFPSFPQGNNGSYTPTSLSNNYASLISGGNQNNYTSQNNQTNKNNFYNKSQKDSGKYNWNSDYSLWKGTIINAVLDTGINTDLPGPVMAHTTKNIYSSKDGNYLLIPQGSRLYGEYNSDISYGQTRVQVVWNTLIRPDGLEINLGSMNGIDSYGYSGYRGLKNEHPFEYAKAMGLIAMYSILDTKMSSKIDSTENTYAQNTMTDVYSETKKLNNKIIDRALDIQPTNIIFSGSVINLITNVSMDLPPYDNYIEVEEPYVRY